ncbi:tyrosine-type recombinase/integrase [Nocardioides daphniae]|uniref:tyrosine-type recombinase/integrase n=1 Tax=Nocardioides daphniae TaxID=402297 RepID=UPI00166DBD5E|nr:tyrosine-type recombinase/integrase [Nocardioides daphniae]
MDADRFAVELQRQLNRGEYIDVNAGRSRFSDYAVTWMERQIVAPTTREAMDVRLRVHLLPQWSAWELRQIRPADIQGWLRRLSDELAPRYVQLLLTNFGAILQGACDDGLIPRNPARSASVRLPSRPTRAVRPWTPEQVLGMVDAVPERFRALVAVAAGCGLRQGEAFGIRVHDIDSAAETLHVRQQIRLEAGKPVPALPKYQRVRSVPVGGWVLEHLERHLGSLQPLSGERRTTPSLGGLVFYSREGKPLNRNYFNQTVWRPAQQAVGLVAERDNGMHALRHTCASLWLEHGVSIKAVSEYLGHADPGFTLRVYTHVMPSSGDKARQALDTALGQGRRPDAAASSTGAPWAHETALTDGN